MKKYCLFFSCIFIMHAGAQTGNKKDVFAFPITDYMVSLTDSVTLVQVEMPAGTNAVIEKESVGLLRGNYSNKNDTTEIGYGRCHLVKGNYYYFSIRLNNIAFKPRKNDLLYTTFDYPAVFKCSIYGLIKNAIYFQHVTEEPFYNFSSAYSMNAEQEASLIDSLVADIRYTGREMIKLNNGMNQDIKGGIFDGKKVLEAMQTVTSKHVKNFIDYVIARPQKYAGNSWKISETFATWMVSSTPTVVK